LAVALPLKLGMLFFYHIFLIFYNAGIRFASCWNAKARLWVEGRKNIFKRLKAAVEKGRGPIIWIHSSSLGEFEQGKPVLESLKTTYPEHRILLTFFSPSGYEIRKNYAGADMIFYLPLDGRIRSSKFLDIVRPKLAIFIKYESWFFYLNGLKQRGIPTLLISAIFTPKQNFFGPLGGFLRTLLESYTHLFVQDAASAAILQRFKLKMPVTVAGDTRYDRVVEITGTSFHHPAIEAFCSEADTIIAGSTWKEDEQMLSVLLEAKPGVKLVIAPHEIDPKHLDEIKKMFKQPILLSELDDTDRSKNARVLIIDCIGMLSKLYRYATISYVGGGFNAAGIHNILEPSAYGKTVIFGPNHDRTAESKALIDAGVGFSYSTQQALVSITEKLLSDFKMRTSLDESAKNFVLQRKGATDIIIRHIEENRILSKS
jgi:3-deoxy-D-manno-octulosonic-acid transferase